MPADAVMPISVVVERRAAHDLGSGVEGGVLAEVQLMQIAELVERDDIRHVDEGGIKSPAQGTCSGLFSGGSGGRPLLRQNGSSLES